MYEFGHANHVTKQEPIPVLTFVVDVSGRLATLLKLISMTKKVCAVAIPSGRQVIPASAVERCRTVGCPT